MAVFIMMPKLNPNMDYGDILACRKDEGEIVRKGEALFNIQVFNTFTEVAVADEGVLLQVLVAPGARVPVNMPLAILGEYGESVGHMVAEARNTLGELMHFEAITGATEKMKYQMPLKELPTAPPECHPELDPCDEKNKQS